MDHLPLYSVTRELKTLLEQFNQLYFLTILNIINIIVLEYVEVISVNVMLPKK